MKELLFNTFERNGVPKHWYKSIVAEIEEEYGYTLDQDNPYFLLEHLNSKVMIAHDRQDSVVPFSDARKIASQRFRISRCEASVTDLQKKQK